MKRTLLRRITPAYFIVILIVILNFSWHDRVSLVLPLEQPSSKCSKYWWTNILYINNFYNWDELVRVIILDNLLDDKRRLRY